VRSGEKRGFLVRASHLLVLCGFAVAQPLFDLLSRYPEFFVARKSEPIDLILLALTLSLGVPGLLVSVVGLGRLLSPKTGCLAHLGVLTILLFTIALQMLKRLTEIPVGVTLFLSLAAAVTICLTYARFRSARTYLTILLPTTLLFPAMFFFDSRISQIVTNNAVEVQWVDVDSTTPVVLVVLDELPLTSLLNAERQIDPVQYPNFADLAKQSHWFRNATSVSDSTLLSIPAILTGRYPKLGPPSLPTASNYPQTLFTLLGSSYHLEVFEDMTRLFTGTVTRESWLQRIGNLVSDLSVVYFHVLLPEDLTKDLPQVTRTWKNFSGQDLSPAENRVPKVKTIKDFQSSAADRAGQFEEFIDSIHSQETPTLYFLHSGLPHLPWTYLPNGQQYALRGASVRGVANSRTDDGTYPKWLEDEWLVKQGYQRHLLQTAFVDRLLGKLLSKLKEVDLFDRSLVVVTADHGVSFRPGDFIRRASKTNHPDIMSVPMLVKTPFQREGVTSDRNVETIDILPTIADVLDVVPPWPLDGSSVLEESRPERTTKTVFAGSRKRYKFDGSFEIRFKNLSEKLRLFGSGTESNLYAIGPFSNLIGRRVSEIGVAGSTQQRVELDGVQFFEDVRLDSRFLLTNITGLFTSPVSAPHVLAVSVNGVVQAVTQTSPLLHEGRDFAALVARKAFRPGRNTVELFSVVELGGRTSLRRCRSETHSSYRLVPSPERQEEALLSPDGNHLPVGGSDVYGQVRSGANQESSTVYVRGFALDVKRAQPVQSVLIFANEELLHSGKTRIMRADVSRRFGESSMTSGFEFEFSRDSFSDLAATRIRVFGVSDPSGASELNYPGRPGSWIFAPPTSNRERPSPYQWNSTIRFGYQGNARWYRDDGWSDPERGFTWSLGKRASLVMRLPEPKGVVSLNATLNPFLHPGALDTQAVVILVNGRRVGRWTISRSGYRPQSMDIPPDFFTDLTRTIITFETPDSAAPVELGVSGDRRVLGVALSSLQLAESAKYSLP